ncbi:hypothetical protein CRUP_003502 [Coryphaenoides rupestris]|nr:hypothetical protein CRUP_003502 [Coryphaenoides rupestris]
MAASCVRAAGSLFAKRGACRYNTNTTTSLLRRQICSSSALHQRDRRATGPEKVTMEFIQKQVEEFNIGKRHLANMMGEDPENFSQGDIDVTCQQEIFPQTEKRDTTGKILNG